MKGEKKNIIKMTFPKLHDLMQMAPKHEEESRGKKMDSHKITIERHVTSRVRQR